MASTKNPVCQVRPKGMSPRTNDPGISRGLKRVANTWNVGFLGWGFWCIAGESKRLFGFILGAFSRKIDEILKEWEFGTKIKNVLVLKWIISPLHK